MDGVCILICVLCIWLAMAAEVRRAANMSLPEKSLLVELIGNHAEILENKETDRITVAEKTAAWKLLAEEFNAVSCVKRSSDQLKQVCHRNTGFNHVAECY